MLWGNVTWVLKVLTILEGGGRKKLYPVLRWAGGGGEKDSDP